MRGIIEGRKVVEYGIYRRKRFTEHFQVDWEANKLAMKASPVSQHHCVNKVESGM